MAFEQAYDVAEKQLPAYQQQLAGYVGLIISTIYAKSRQQIYFDNSDADLINLSMKIMRENTHRVVANGGGSPENRHGLLQVPETVQELHRLLAHTVSPPPEDGAGQRLAV